MQRPASLTATAALMLLTAVGIVLFWIVFFADLDAQRASTFASRSEVWFAWELSFPLADAWVALAATAGAIGLWRDRPAGLLFGLVSAGGLVFLGLIDLLFFLENGLYLPMNADTAPELIIHLWAIGFGASAIVTIWNHRNKLVNQLPSEDTCTHNP
jgi:hypothetical protein